MITYKKKKHAFEYLHIKNSAAQAKIALQGAHIFHYSNQKNLLWLSETSPFEHNKAIRGGIPLCWPAFGTNNPDLPQHGFARTTLFEVLSLDETQADTSILVLRLQDNAQTRAIWDYRFELLLTITIGATLSLQLQTTNKDTKAFTLTQAFHTYFAISDIQNISIKGLEEKPYLDALQHKQKTQKGTIKFTQEFDAVYQNVDKTILLNDTITTQKIDTQGSASCVVWNPWIEKCSRMSGMKENAYKEFVCIESANAYDDFKLLQPQESHTLAVTFTTL